MSHGISNLRSHWKILGQTSDQRISMTLKPPTNQLYALPVSQLNEPSPLHNLTYHVLLLWLFGDEPSAAER